MASDGLILNFWGPQGARNFTGGRPPAAIEPPLVAFAGTISTPQMLACGVPGSVVDPLLFVLYTADVLKIAANHSVCISARIRKSRGGTVERRKREARDAVGAVGGGVFWFLIWKW